MRTDGVRSEDCATAAAYEFVISVTGTSQGLSASLDSSLDSLQLESVSLESVAESEELEAPVEVFELSDFPDKVAS